MMWEYKVIFYEYGPFEASLESLGKEGWELVQVMRIAGPNIEFPKYRGFFKRKIT